MDVDLYFYIAIISFVFFMSFAWSRDDEMVDVEDLKSSGAHPPCRFKSGSRHHVKSGIRSPESGIKVLILELGT